MRAILASAAILLATTAAGSAACNVKEARLEEAIAAKKTLREAANAQTVRDLRTLRDAAIVLETYKFEPECERLIAIIRTLVGDPDKAIERGDTDEEKAEEVEEAREPKAPAKAPAKPQ